MLDARAWMAVGVVLAVAGCGAPEDVPGAGPRGPSQEGPADAARILDALGTIESDGALLRRVAWSSSGVDQFAVHIQAVSPQGNATCTASLDGQVRPDRPINLLFTAGGNGTGLAVLLAGSGIGLAHSGMKVDTVPGAVPMVFEASSVGLLAGNATMQVTFAAVAVAGQLSFAFDCDRPVRMDVAAAHLPGTVQGVAPGLLEEGTALQASPSPQCLYDGSLAATLGGERVLLHLVDWPDALLGSKAAVRVTHPGGTYTHAPSGAGLELVNMEGAPGPYNVTLTHMGAGCPDATGFLLGLTDVKAGDEVPGLELA